MTGQACHYPQTPLSSYPSQPSLHVSRGHAAWLFPCRAPSGFECSFFQSLWVTSRLQQSFRLPPPHPHLKRRETESPGSREICGDAEQRVWPNCRPLTLSPFVLGVAWGLGVHGRASGSTRVCLVGLVHVPSCPQVSPEHPSPGWPCRENSAPCAWDSLLPQHPWHPRRAQHGFSIGGVHHSPDPQAHRLSRSDQPSEVGLPVQPLPAPLRVAPAPISCGRQSSRQPVTQRGTF